MERKSSAEDLPSAYAIPAGHSIAAPHAVTTPGQSAPPGGAATLVVEINALFGVFEAIYPAMYRRAWPDEASENAAKRLWRRSLEGYPPAAISNAAQKLLRHEEFLPTPARFLRLLHSLFFPWPEDAFLEACHAPHPKDEQRWSHVLVYQAGYATGWEVLEKWPPMKAQARFGRIYEEGCRRALLRAAARGGEIPSTGAWHSGSEITAPPPLSIEQRKKQLHWARRQQRKLRAPEAPQSKDKTAARSTSKPPSRSRPRPSAKKGDQQRKLRTPEAPQSKGKTAARSTIKPSSHPHPGAKKEDKP